MEQQPPRARACQIGGANPRALSGRRPEIVRARISLNWGGGGGEVSGGAERRQEVVAARVRCTPYFYTMYFKFTQKTSVGAIAAVQ